ncbi:MAG: hypothetical protein F7B61_00970 [Caldisphaeraceae archaeon]|nr:hypothetical protein [Caldisphaeraceae archaeon]
MSIEKISYRLSMRKTSKGPIIMFKMGGKGLREYTLIRIGGRNAEQIFNEMINTLQGEGLIQSKSERLNYKSYKLKGEIGKAVGGYLVLIRRSREQLSWLPYFSDFIKGNKYEGSREVLSHFLDLSMDLSKSKSPERNKVELDPKILDALGAGIKVISKTLWKI